MPRTYSCVADKVWALVLLLAVLSIAVTIVSVVVVGRRVQARRRHIELEFRERAPQRWLRGNGALVRAQRQSGVEA